MVKLYQGAYTHDDIFNLSVSEVYAFKLMHLENNYLEQQRNKVRDQERKQKSKKR